MKEPGSGVDFGPVYLMSTSTIGVAFCRELDAAHRKLDQNLVAMPVLGNPDMAAKRELFILLGGPAEAIERCRPVIERFGQRSFHVGEMPWLASAMKLAGNKALRASLFARHEEKQIRSGARNLLLGCG